MTTTPDSSGNGYVGTIVNNTSTVTLVTSPWTSAWSEAVSTDTIFDGTGYQCGVDGGAWDSGGVPAVSGVGVAAVCTLEIQVQISSGSQPEGGSGAISGWETLSDSPFVIYSTGIGDAWAFYWNDNTGAPQSINGGTVDTSAHVIAVDYDGTTMRLYLDGTMIASQATTGIHPFTSGAHFYISTDNNGDNVNAAFNECRWSNVARYASDGGYTPNTSPFVTDGNTLALYHLENFNVEPLVKAAYGAGWSYPRLIKVAPTAAAFSSGFVQAGFNGIPSISGFAQAWVPTVLAPFLTIKPVMALGSVYAVGMAIQVPGGSAFGGAFVVPVVPSFWPSADEPTIVPGDTPSANPGGTVAAGSWRWQMVDPAGVLDTFIWEQNPNLGTFPAEQKQINMTPTTGAAGPVLLFEGRPQVGTTQVQGTFFTEYQYNGLLQWFNLRRPFYLVDDLANQWTVYITEWQPGRRQSRNFNWKTDYTLYWIVLDVQYSADPGPGFSFAGAVG